VYTPVDNGCGTRICEGEDVGTATAYMLYVDNKIRVGKFIFEELPGTTKFKINSIIK